MLQVLQAIVATLTKDKATEISILSKYLCTKTCLLLIVSEAFDIRAIKWVAAATRTFVNLKSNTMKNTLQRYRFCRMPSKKRMENTKKVSFLLTRINKRL